MITIIAFNFDASLMAFNSSFSENIDGKFDVIKEVKINDQAPARVMDTEKTPTLGPLLMNPNKIIDNLAYIATDKVDITKENQTLSSIFYIYFYA